MRGARSGHELITIPISHYCEKARWALDRAGIAFRERAHLQIVHWFHARRAGGGMTVPVLVTPQGVLTQSADIVDYADRHAPPGKRLFSGDPAEAAEARALQRDFDDRLGPHGRRWMYDSLRGNREIVRAYGPTGVPAWERLALPVMSRLVFPVVDRYLDIDDDSVAESERELRASFDEVGERLSDGRRYLVGDTFSAADLAFASMAAAVLMPPEYGVPLPQPDELPVAMGETVRELRAHPAGAFAMELFRRERR